jgi:hypothetical protein
MGLPSQVSETDSQYWLGLLVTIQRDSLMPSKKSPATLQGFCFAELATIVLIGRSIIGRRTRRSAGSGRVL